MAGGRRTRGRSFRHGKHRYQWFGFQNSDVVVDSAAIDSFIIVPTSAAVTEQSDGTLVRTVISLTISAGLLVRANNNTLVMNLQKTETDTGGTPTNIVDPVATDGFSLGNGDILGWWQVAVPETTPPVVATQTAYETSHYESRAKRKLKVRMHAIVLAFRGFSAIDLKLSLVARALMQY